MAGKARERARHRLLAAACLITLLFGWEQQRQASHAAALREQQQEVQRLVRYVGQLKRRPLRPDCFRAAHTRLVLWLIAAESRQRLRSRYPKLELSAVSSAQLQESYAQAWSLSRDAKSRHALDLVEERYQEALAFTTAEEAAAGYHSQRL